MDVDIDVDVDGLRMGLGMDGIQVGWDEVQSTLLF